MTSQIIISYSFALKNTSAYQPTERWTKIMIVLRYITTGGQSVTKIKRHIGVVKSLYAFKRNHLILFRAYFIYILPYISKTLLVSEKQQILINHYSLLRKKFRAPTLKQLFGDGVICYTETVGDDVYSIILKSVTNHLEFEGSMNLIFTINEIKLYTLSFTFTPGYIFGYDDEQIVYISSIQGSKDQFLNIRNATRHFSDNALPLILLKILESIALQFDIKMGLGISVENQLSFKEDSNYDHFYTHYDKFWIDSGAVCENQNFVINFPLQQKPLMSINQTHRNRTKKKRLRLQELSYAVSANLTAIFFNNSLKI